MRRRAERVIRPTRAKTRRLRVLVITVPSPRPIRAEIGDRSSSEDGHVSSTRFRKRDEALGAVMRDMVTAKYVAEAAVSATLAKGFSG